MSESGNYPAGVYEKDGRTVVAQSPATAVALTFDGYRLVKEVDDVNAHDGEEVKLEADYRDLQKQAKELGINANQSADELRKQIDDALND